MNIKISVIVPIYKVERYLRQCIDSIINQTYSNLEIILVDDGSPDNCGIICDEYAKIDKRIKVIHKENGGLSSARNAGLDIATGEYIGFVDSDDYIDKTMYEELINSIKKYDSDISTGMFFNKYRFFRKNSKGFDKELVFKGKDKFINTKVGYKCIYFNVWSKLYKREIFDNIRFPEGMCFEDSYIIYEILDKAESISYVPKYLYYYRIRKNSISKKDCCNCLDQIKSHNKNISFHKMKQYYDLVDYESYSKCLTILNNAYKLGYKSINDDRYKSQKDELVNTLNELKNSKYLSSKQMSNINKISSNIDKYYKKLVFRLKLENTFKRILYYK